MEYKLKLDWSPLTCSGCLALSVGLTRFLRTTAFCCFGSVFIGPSLHKIWGAKQQHSSLLVTMKINETTMKPLYTYMVQHPGTVLITWETALPISFQAIEFLPWSELILGCPCCPKFLNRQFTKSDGVIPSLLCALTNVINVFVMSNKASASATCSLGFCTVNQVSENKI